MLDSLTNTPAKKLKMLSLQGKIEWLPGEKENYIPGPRFVKGYICQWQYMSS